MGASKFRTATRLIFLSANYRIFRNRELRIFRAGAKVPGCMLRSLCSCSFRKLQAPFPALARAFRTGGNAPDGAQPNTIFIQDQKKDQNAP
jgi:hypothetical protein